jgi:hypothetical protein
MDYTLTLIGIGILATLALTILFYWHAFFWRSWGRFIRMLTGGYEDMKDLVDPDKKIEPDISASRSDILKARAEAVEAVPLSPDTLLKAQAIFPEQENGQFDATTSDSGWPRTLSEEERRDSRPFRHVHIATENEELSNQTPEQTDSKAEE